MLKTFKHGFLSLAKQAGATAIVASSSWRQKRLTILCYHGISLADEHLWRPMYIPPAFFRRRMEILSQSRYQVIPLAEAVELLRAGELPPKSVVITFDDGFYDFYQEAFPVLREFGYPATVYQTTFYCDQPFPIFNLALSYLFWHSKGQRLDGRKIGLSDSIDLSRPDVQERVVGSFLKFVQERKFTPAQQNELAEQIAGELSIDYSRINRLKMLRLMTPAQVSEIAAAGIDIQLHTHRHRTPVDENLFLREIRDNRSWILSETGTRADHFCYPSGVWRKEFLPWLRSEGVVSGTTCETGIATRKSEPLLLPRVLDSTTLSDNDFEGWLSGVSSFLPRRRMVRAEVS